MIEAIAVMFVGACTLICTVIAFLLTRNIRSMDNLLEKHDKRIKSLEDNKNRLDLKVGVLQARDELQLKPLERQIDEIKTNMVNKEVFESYTAELAEFRKAFTEHTSAHKGIKDQVDKIIDKRLSEFKKTLK